MSKPYIYLTHKHNQKLFIMISHITCAVPSGEGSDVFLTDGIFSEGVSVFESKEEIAALIDEAMKP